MTHQRSSIRTWALVSVAVTSAFLMWIAWWLITTIASPDWCNRALGAQIVADRANGSVRPEYAVGGCFSLLKQQVEALALNSHIAIAILALCLLSLVVIVLAGGRLSFKASRDGIEGNMERDGE